MAIAHATKLLKPEEPVLVRKEVISPPRPIAVDTKYEPRANLLTHVAGAKWNVIYYKQLKTSEEASEAFNINRPLPYQQYLKIENFELRVSTPLTASPNNEESAHNVTGTAFIYPSIVPDHGDSFLADVGDGRSAIFNIREVTQKSFLKDTVYEIEYDLVDWLSHDLQKAIDAKVVKTGYYERSYLDYGANPVLEEEQHGIFKKIRTWQERIARHYFDSFYNHEFNTFLVPVPGKVIYDPFIVEFIQRLWDTNTIPDLQYLKVYNRDTADNRFIRTIWDAIVHNDPYMLAKCKSKFGVIPRQLFPTDHGGLMGVRFSRLDYIFHPYDIINPATGVISIFGHENINLGESFSEYSTNRTFNLAIKKLPGLGFVHHTLKENLPIPDAKKMGSFDTYVLSPAFYQNTKSEMSKVELLLTAAFKEEHVNAKELLPILEDVINWGEMERFYYIPLLTALSRSALGDLTQ